MKYQKKLSPKEIVEASEIYELTADLATDLHFSYIFPLLPFC